MLHKDFKNHTIPVINSRTINRTCDFKDFHLSYNPSVADYGCDTTAIVFGGSLFFILNGDHQKALHEAANTGGKMGCFSYYVDNIHLANKISEHHPVTGNASDLFGLRNMAIEHLGAHAVERLANADSELNCADITQ